MNIKVLIINHIRQLNSNISRTAYYSNRAYSAYRGQGRILNILKENPELSRTELGEMLSMSRQNIAELLNKLENNGYITRSVSSQDRRKVVISLTEAGMQEAENSAIDKTPIPDFLNCLSGEELNQFNEYLERMLKFQSKNTAAGRENSYDSDSRSGKDSCIGCPGPENCTHDYLKYGHDRPNPDYCKWADRFPF